ncbi:hypothetical protein CL2_12410 [Anaerostipes hadrus]|uniref:Uncharacterized protein n=1 Tax=Anaerostipes hadrus TaxID=649756 RepID=D4N022_ANAHA|nr:hypothetical protein CL2_12410 [Anaerostipes hadrus]
MKIAEAKTKGDLK